MKRFGRVEGRRYVPGKKVYELNLKAIEYLFLIDMAAEGGGVTILTRALQLVLATTKLLGSKIYSHLF